MTDLSADSLPGDEEVADDTFQPRRSRLSPILVFGSIFALLAES